MSEEVKIEFYLSGIDGIDPTTRDPLQQLLNEKITIQERILDGRGNRERLASRIEKIRARHSRI